MSRTSDLLPLPTPDAAVNVSSLSQSTPTRPLAQPPTALLQPTTRPLSLGYPESFDDVRAWLPAPLGPGHDADDELEVLLRSPGEEAGAARTSPCQRCHLGALC